jgi:FMN reductase
VETRRITVLSAGLGVPSSSRLLADQLAASVERKLVAAGYSVAVDVVELRDLAVDIANNFVTGYAAPRLADVIAGVSDSDGIIADTPVFSA